MAKRLSEIVQNMHPLTRPTLKNWARMAVSPTGVRDFANAVAEDLNLTEDSCGAFLKYSGTLFDAGKYLLYGLTAGALLYQNVIQKIIE
jgi:hypothetical protein